MVSATVWNREGVWLARSHIADMLMRGRYRKEAGDAEYPLLHFRLDRHELH